MLGLALLVEVSCESPPNILTLFSPSYSKFEEFPVKARATNVTLSFAEEQFRPLGESGPIGQRSTHRRFVSSSQYACTQD